MSEFGDLNFVLERVLTRIRSVLPEVSFLVEGDAGNGSEALEVVGCLHVAN